jgi:uncharacterized phiE125 gp8 family phage protein
MSLILTGGPVIEPITLADAKLHLRVDSNTEDALIASLILTSRMHIEATLDLALITQSWSYFTDAWPADPVMRLPMRPVQAITALRQYAADGSYETIAPNRYILDGTGPPARLVRRDAPSFVKPGRAANGIEIAFTAGYGNTAADVPAAIRQSILLLVAHWYDNRDVASASTQPAGIPALITDLLNPYRMPRL